MPWIEGVSWRCCKRIRYRPDPGAFLAFALIGIFFVQNGEWILLAAIPVAVAVFSYRREWLAIDFMIGIPFYLSLLRPDNLNNDGLDLAAQLDGLTGYSLREAALNAVQGSPDAVWLAKLMVFNERNGHAEQYTQLKQLAILHMMVVSGTHISMIAAIVCWCFRKRWAWVGKGLALLLLGTYVYTLDFALASMRAFLSFGLGLAFRRWGLKGTANVALTMAIMLAMNPRFAFSAGFQLSFASAFFISHFAEHVTIKNFAVKALAITLLATVVTLPIMASIIKTVSLLSVVYNLVYGMAMPLLFFYYSIFAFMPFMVPVSDFLAAALIGSLRIASQFNVFLPLQPRLGVFIALHYAAMYASTSSRKVEAACARIGVVSSVFLHSLV